MKHTLLFAVVTSSLVFATISEAAISNHDLSGFTPLTTTGGVVSGLTIAPFSGGLRSYYGVDSFLIMEDGKLSIGMGNPVPVGTDLTGFFEASGTAGSLHGSSSSGRYYFPFSKNSDTRDSDPNSLSLIAATSGVGYLTVDFNNATQTMSFVSSTVQDESGGTLIVGAVPEISSALLALIGSLSLLRRRR